MYERDPDCASAYSLDAIERLLITILAPETSYFRPSPSSFIVTPSLS